ncbi:MAG: hypothetical protein HSCHL_1812 [Hydrogenibacillus schlegelii]|uniref:Uncharacterized protein n=2 Tax=Hydrogenibacillus schlegelii TaxID=1484 RepID=A0A2T5GF99_HYDSH|nr:YlaH-like family protein [Hydrogenibacillus schlegelii]PTQ54869.1 MAG: hypothetical protein HSCHL_1812 [Hydrogenibacillus schlegelii]
MPGGKLWPGVLKAGFLAGDVLALSGGAALPAFALWDRFGVKYAVVTLLLALVFRLGFERPLPPGKRVLVYGLLVALAFPLVVLAYVLPIAEALGASLIVLIVYRWRRRRERADAAKGGSPRAGGKGA